MRLQLAHGLLLALILGLISIHPFHCYVANEEQTANDLAQVVPDAGETSGGEGAPASNPDSKDVGGASAQADVDPSENQAVSAEDANQQAKRNLGMPVSSRELSGPPEGLSASQKEAQEEEQQPASKQDSSKEQDNEEGTRLRLPPSLNQPQPTHRVGSTARGIMSSLSGSSSSANQQVPSPSQSASGAEQSSQVPAEDLPTIIENNKPVKPQSPSSIQQDGLGQPANPPEPLNNNNNNQQQQQSAPQQLQQGTNSSLPMSSARTFDSWTNCVGAASNKYGTCKNDIECGKAKGTADGSCMGGLGVCCIVALSCGDKSFENNTFFANSDYPEPSWEARLCEVELKKKHSKILQIMIEFVEFELAPPNQEGECVTDVFQVKLSSNRPSPYSLLRVCGQNTGQHMYLDVSQVDEPLLLSVATSGGGFPRRWSIRIVQMDEKNHLLAPPGCLQYYTDTLGHFRSFNLGRNLKNLYYAICFRIDNGYSGIRFTENFFGMNGPFCRKRIGGVGGHLGGPGGRYNNSGIVAHPHHLVIPPPGYGVPPPRPGHYQQKYGPQHVGGYHQLPPPPAAPNQQYLPQQQPPQNQPLTRYKRLGYLEPVDRQQRTLHEHEHHERHHEHEHKHHEHSPPPPHHGGYSNQAYGPPPPPMGYGPPPPHPHAYGYSGYPDQKVLDLKDRTEDKFFLGKQEAENKAAWGWNSAFGWVGARKDEKLDKVDNIKHYGRPYAEYNHHQSGYGYGKSAYGPYHQHAGNHYAGYGKPIPGYHSQYHKEIDKFGEQYEHLEYKHEKNHSGKDKEVVKSSWWPSWGSAKKDEKKHEKFQQHHEALFPMIQIPEMPHCEPRFCGNNDVITFPPSGDSIAEMCGNRFNRGKGPKIISGSPLVIYVSNRGHTRGAGFDMNYEQVFYIPRPY